MNNDMENCFKKMIIMWLERLTKSQNLRLHTHTHIYIYIYIYISKSFQDLVEFKSH